MPRARQPGRRWKLLLSVGFGLVLGELAARILLGTPQVVTIYAAERGEDRRALESAEAVDLTLPEHPEQGGVYVETETGRRLRANCRAVIENHTLSERRIEIRTNAIGYRNPQIGLKQRHRILFLGDSITFGDCLQEPETFVRQVEKIAAAGGRSWETINAGVGGISLANELHILEETGLDLDPDVVVLGFYLNDFQESPAVYVPRLPVVLEHSRLLYHLVRVIALWSRPESEHHDVAAWREAFVASHELQVGDYRTSQAAFDQLVTNHFRDWGAAFGPEAWEVIRPMLLRLKHLSVQHDFQLVIVAFPTSVQVVAKVSSNYPQQQLKAIANQLQVPLLDTLPILQAEWHSSGQRLFYDVCHHTPYANRILAEHITEFLLGVTAQ